MKNLSIYLSIYLSILKIKPSWLELQIRRLLMYRSVRPASNVCPGYNSKLFIGEAPVLEFWEMCNTLSLPLLLGPARAVVTARITCKGRIEICNRFL